MIKQIASKYVGKIIKGYTQQRYVYILPFYYNGSGRPGADGMVNVAYIGWKTKRPPYINGLAMGLFYPEHEKDIIVKDAEPAFDKHYLIDYIFTKLKSDSIGIL